MYLFCHIDTIAVFAHTHAELADKILYSLFYALERQLEVLHYFGTSRSIVGYLIELRLELTLSEWISANVVCGSERHFWYRVIFLVRANLFLGVHIYLRDREAQPLLQLKRREGIGSLAVARV